MCINMHYSADVLKHFGSSVRWVPTLPSSSAVEIADLWDTVRSVSAPARPAGVEGGREAGGGAGPDGLRQAGARSSVGAVRGAARRGGPLSFRITEKNVAVPRRAR